ncbi:hypothetical protein WJX72_006204 [[Myrmecia] bisecta]|uniref:T4 RNA ligase 1-like N-terminal domain-containing protein n=1 Tax=[Myrmecia] bisecta TaxID=41462 RepID=A0AAW1Q0E9_9CHLO
MLSVHLSYDGLVRADFSLRAVRQSRGIVIEKDTNRVVCFPFEKFFNAGEKYAAELDWATASVSEKLDGSLMKVYYDPISKDWLVATNNLLDASEATFNSNSRQMTFRSLFDEAVACTLTGSTSILEQPSSQWPTLPYEAMDKRYTYMFEMCHPASMILVQHSAPHLAHLVTRWVYPVDPDLPLEQAGSHDDFDYPELADVEVPGIPKVRELPLRTLAECKEAADQLTDPTKAEGFVVRDAQFRRLKIKSPSYVAADNALTNPHSTAYSSYVLWTVLKGEEGEVAASLPALKERLQTASRLLDAYLAGLIQAYLFLRQETLLLEPGSKAHKTAWAKAANLNCDKMMFPVLLKLSLQDSSFQPEPPTMKAVLADYYDDFRTRGGEDLRSKRLKQLLDYMRKLYPHISKGDGLPSQGTD